MAVRPRPKTQNRTQTEQASTVAVLVSPPFCEPYLVTAIRTKSSLRPALSFAGSYIPSGDSCELEIVEPENERMSSTVLSASYGGSHLSELSHLAFVARETCRVLRTALGLGPPTEEIEDLDEGHHAIVWRAESEKTGAQAVVALCILGASGFSVEVLAGLPTEAERNAVTARYRAGMSGTGEEWEVSLGGGSENVSGEELIAACTRATSPGPQRRSRAR